MPPFEDVLSSYRAAAATVLRRGLGRAKTSDLSGTVSAHLLQAG